MKRWIIWVLTTLFLISAYASRFPKDDPRFDQPVNLTLVTKQATNELTKVALPLDVVLESLAKSVGLKPLIYHVYGTLNSVKDNKAQHEPDWPLVRIDFNGKPFREVWDLLFDTYGVKYQMDYIYIPPDIVLVAPINQLRIFNATKQQKDQKWRLERYKIEVPVNTYLKVIGQKNEGATIEINLKGAEDWFKQKFIPYLMNEIGPISTNWLLIQENEEKIYITPKGRVSYNPAVILFSMYATSKQHQELTQYMKLSGLKFKKLTLTPKNQTRAAKPQAPPKVVRKYYTVSYIKAEDAVRILKKEFPGITVTLVPGRNLLIIHATEAQHQEIKDILSKIDIGQDAQTNTKSSAKEPTVKRFYTLTYIKPDAAIEFLSKEIPGIKITQVPGQKLIVVRGTEEQQREVQNLLAKIDIPPVKGPPIYQRTFRISNAKAEELAKVLLSALQARKLTTTQSDTDQTTQTHVDQAGDTSMVSIVADPRTNTLIATGTSEQLQLIEELVKKLDVPSKLVKLKIQVYTVNKSVSDQLGIDWGTIAGGNLVASILDGALNLIFDATRSLASLNIAATLHALSEQNLAKQLSDAVIYVENNYGYKPDTDLREAGTKAGELQVGGQLLLPIKAANGEESLREFNVGLTLRFWAQIASPDEVILELYAQTGGDPTDGPQNSIFIPKKSLLTRFRIKNGQTLVLGGLTEEKHQYSEKKVPLLGDIPVIGSLFKSTNFQKTGDEIIVTVTPEIVESTGKTTPSTP